ncbi:MAG: tetratricopeptide repeat protein [Burkholderiales bacterium]|nr:tetratricopeptide repeat protein [Burkholderiales bacterium]
MLPAEVVAAAVAEWAAAAVARAAVAGWPCRPVARPGHARRTQRHCAERLAGRTKVLQAALADSPHFADYHNLYAYAVRKGPNPDMALVFKHYTEALRINPRHLDALEYMGEAYLSINQPDKAKENLQRLDSLCFFGCEQYRELKQAIATYEAGRR